MRDSLCPLDLLSDVRQKMAAKNELHVVEGGDHSLQATKTQLKASGLSQEEVDARCIAAIREFVAARVDG